MNAIELIEQQPSPHAVQPWVLDRAGVRLQAHDHNRRLSALREGIVRHPGVRASVARTSSEEVERTLAILHDRDYLRALRQVRPAAPVLMAQFAAPGMAPDTPVCAEVAVAAVEGIRAAIGAAREILEGARFAYALCGPPGHHAGPAWLGGCCYLNNAAAAVQTLRSGSMSPVGILDLDIHYPNGTAAIAARMADTSLHSLHAWPVVNVPSQTVEPCSEREHAVEFGQAPSESEYLGAAASSIDALAGAAVVLVVSLGYDTVAGDPHGGWGFSPRVFAALGRLLASSGLPICVIQEGGYALDSLAECGYAFVSGLLEDEL